MWPFSKKRVVIFLSNTSLSVNLSKAVSKKLDLPANVFKNLTILDQKGFGELVKRFLLESHLKESDVILVLSEKVIFQKTVLKSEADALQKFLDEIPLEPERTSIAKLEKGRQIFLFAASKSYWESITKIINELGGKVIAVVPISAFPEGRQDPDRIKRSLDKFKVSFTSKLKEEELEIKPKRWKLIGLGVTILLFAVALVLLLVVLNIKLPSPFNLATQENQDIEAKISPLNQQEDAASASAQTISTASAEQATVSAKINKEALTVRILNGTGIAGQASSTRTVLGDFGFTKIELDNATSGAKDTVAAFSKNVSKEIRDEVLGILETTFNKVVSQDSLDPEVDILITTGEYK